MKKLLILMLVFGLASLANATVIDVVTDGLGDMGHAGTAEDRLEESETIAIQIVLNWNPYPGTTYPSYDGYVLDTLAVDLHVSGPGTLSAVMATSKTGDYYVPLGHHVDLGTYGQSDPLIVGNSIALISGGSMGYIMGDDGVGGPAVPPTALIWNLWIHCDGPGDIVVDLTVAGTTRYWDYSNAANDGPFGTSNIAVEADLGDLTIYQVPEPATIALLGLGSLFLMRRRRK